MAIVINTNVDSLIIQRSLNAATLGASKAINRLTTGFRINSAADDPAGLIISKGLSVQQSGSERAISNAQNGINMLKTAEGTLAQIQDHMMAINDLTLQAMNGGLSVSEVTALENEAKARAEEIDRIANGAMFNEFKLFDTTKTAATAGITFQVGANSDAGTNTITTSNVFYGATMSALTSSVSGGVSSSSFSFTSGGAIKSRSELETLLSQVQAGISNISSRRGVIGASSIRLETAIDTLYVQNENLAAANSRIKDADVAKESSNYTRNKILQEASAALLVQANQAPNIALTLI